MAFYRFVRFADDIADHATAAPDEKLRLLEEMRASLWAKAMLAGRRRLCARFWPNAIFRPVHALDLLEAFRRDVTKLRYRDWDDLLDYCRYSAMPVGRFVLDVHGESRGTWPANDALCAALQVINHLQDCGKDYRDLNRVYIPQDALAAADVGGRGPGRPGRQPGLKSVIAGLARKNAELLAISRAFARQIQDYQACLGSRSHSNPRRRFERQTRPAAIRLSQTVHHSKTACRGPVRDALPGFAFRRLTR